MKPLSDASRGTGPPSGAAYVFPADNRGGHRTTITKAFKKIVKVAGVREDTRPYDLRKAFATRIISAGADLKTAMSLTWHTQVAVLMKYCGQGGCPRSSVRPWTRRWR
jgi:site-specific recombinase XerD